MESSQETDQDVAVHVENLGGIKESTVHLQTGVNVLSGRNATNRTSFLRAVMGALGSDRVSLKADAETGTVRLDLDGQTYSRRFERRNGAVRSDGEPYLDDPTLADLFAFLLESNEARVAVSRRENLRDLIMRPVDIEEIREAIAEQEATKRRLDTQLETYESLANELPDLEAKKQRLRENIDETESALEDARAELTEMDGTVKASRSEEQELDEALSELQSVQSRIEETRFQRETERESVETLREEQTELHAQLESIEAAPADKKADLDARLESLREQQAELERTTSQLQSVIQFNKEMLSGTNVEIAAALGNVETDTEDDDPTSQLLEETSMVTCWTCGSQVETEQIEETIEQLSSLRREKLSERNERRTEITRLTEQRKSVTETRDQRERLRRRSEQTEAEIDRRTERIGELSETLESLREQAQALEDRIETLETEDENAVLEQHKEITQLEFTLSQQENEYDDVVEQIEQIETKLAKRESLTTEREEVRQRLTELRTRIERIEADAVEAFNEHMEAVLEILGYDNLERIWIERTTRTVRDGRKRVEESVFQLHIVRSGADGTAYEDTIDHLSESEREVTGLVFALAGYLVHEVHNEVPFMILDSLEAIDSSRIAALVDYFSQYVETIIVALLPEDANALNDSYHRVTEI